MKPMFLIAALTSVVSAHQMSQNLMKHFSEGRSSFQNHSRAVSDQWGPENGWSWDELNFLSADLNDFLSCQFAEYPSGQKQWLQRLNGNTVEIGSGSISVSGDNVTVKTSGSDYWTYNVRVVPDRFMPLHELGSFDYGESLLFRFDKSNLVSMNRGATSLFHCEYTKDNKISSFSSKELVSTRTFDTNGNMVSSITKRGETVTHRSDFELNADGSLKAKYDFAGDDTLSKTLYSYQNLGKKQIESYVIYYKDAVDAKWKLTTRRSNSEDTLLHTMSSTYMFISDTDSTGLEVISYFSGSNMCLKGEEYSINGKEKRLESSVLFTYDNRNNLQSVVCETNVAAEPEFKIDAHTDSSIVTYQYGENGWPVNRETKSYDGEKKQWSSEEMAITYSSDPTPLLPSVDAVSSSITMVSDGSTIRWVVPAGVNRSIRISSVSGKKIGSVEVHGGTGLFSTKELSRGVYVWSVDGVQSGRFVIP